MPQTKAEQRTVWHKGMGTLAHDPPTRKTVKDRAQVKNTGCRRRPRPSPAVLSCTCLREGVCVCERWWRTRAILTHGEQGGGMMESGVYATTFGTSSSFFGNDRNILADFSAPHTPYARRMVYLVPMLIGVLIGAWGSMVWPIWGFGATVYEAAIGEGLVGARAFRLQAPGHTQ